MHQYPGFLLFIRRAAVILLYQVQHSVGGTTVQVMDVGLEDVAEQTGGTRVLLQFLRLFCIRSSIIYAGYVIRKIINVPTINGLYKLQS